MTHPRSIVVPLNHEVVPLKNFGNEDCIEWNLTEEEFKALWDSRIFKLINKKCEINIDDYESETLPLLHSGTVRVLIEKHHSKGKLSDELARKFLMILHQLDLYQTTLYFEF